MSTTDAGSAGRGPLNIYSIAKNIISGAATFRDILVKALLDEETYVTSITRELANSDTINIHIKNPVDSGVSPVFYFGEITRGGDAEVTLHTSVSSVSSTSSIDTDNNMIGSSSTSELEIDEVGSFSSADTHFQQRYLGSGTETIFDGYRLGLLEGEEFILEVESLSGGNFVGLRIGWWEFVE